MFEETEAKKIYKSVPPVSDPLTWKNYTFHAGCLAVAIGLYAANFSMILSLIVASLPAFPSVFPYFAIIVAQYFFFPTPALEEPNRSARRLKSYQGSFPNGWFQVLASHELKEGQVVEVGALGRDFAVYRGRKTGVVGVLDAHCPHLGANMAVGGSVAMGTDCLTCPFHGWQFNSDGGCTHIPHLPKENTIPCAANARAYHVCEYYGMILMWFHADDEPPSYYPPNVKCLDIGNFYHRGTFDTEVNMHLQEFAENSADFLHFDPIHGHMMVPFSPFYIPGVEIVHRPGWKPGTRAKSFVSHVGSKKDLDDEKKEEKADDAPKTEKEKKKPEMEGHMSWFSNSASLTFHGKPIPDTAAHADITFMGCGSLVMFHFNTPVGDIVMFQTHLPVTAMRQRTRFTWYADFKMPRLLVWYVVGQWLSQWRNDLSVWENKKFINKPVLVKGDGPIMAQRRWFSQFYSKSSLTTNKSLDW